MKTILIALIATLGLWMAAPSFANEQAKTLDTMEENILLYVDINNDGAEKIADLLNGVGTQKAQAIIAYRNEHGPFETADDLVNVPGIGIATLEKNRAIIIISPLDA